jgi:DNA-directed RNA polymerase subunit alpha
VLLSSLQGAAVTAVQIDGVLHEFSSIPGVREDVTDIVLNIKEIAIKMAAKAQAHGRAQAGPGRREGRRHSDGRRHRDPQPRPRDLHARRGRGDPHGVHRQHRQGLRPGRAQPPEDAPIGLIPVDSLYSPVKKVSYKVENTREGQVLDYDKLTMTSRPTVRSVRKMPSRTPRASCRTSWPCSSTSKSRRRKEAEEAVTELPFNPALLKKVDELELSVRSANCLKNDNIVYIGDLIQKTEAEMLRTPNFGRKSLNEIKEVLARWACISAWKCRNWPPENIEDLAKRYEDHLTESRANAGEEKTMRHGKDRPKLGRTASHRKAMFANMAAR